MNVHLIQPKDALILRQKILRPGLRPEECVYPQDQAADTFHVGAFFNGKIIGVATFLLEVHPELTARKPYRLRGMATDVNFQMKGTGRSVLQFGLIELRRRTVDLLWCNARQSAFGFYEKLGLQYHGPLFEISDIGPHKVMYKDF